MLKLQVEYLIWKSFIFIVYRGLGVIRAVTSPLPEPYALVVEAKDYVMVLGYPISIY